jgi:hypothetical protein
VATVSAAHDRLACVRVDKNESCSSTVHDFEQVLDGRIEPSGSTDPSQLVSIEIFQEKMAVIRVDLPAREETRFMVMLRVGDPWQFVLERRSRKDV